MKEREIAYNVLVKVVDEGSFSNIALRNTEGNSPLVTQLVYGTLRNYRLVREAWSKSVKKLPNIKICILLDMATYEILLLNKPTYATVNEIVDIAKKVKGGAFVNFVNAVLRNIDKSSLNNESLAITTSHPDWLVNLWNSHYGKEISEKICLEDCLDGKVSLRVNNLLTTTEQLLNDPKFTKGTVDGCLYYDGNIIESNYFKEKKVIIQSESSQLAVNTLDVKDNMRVLDMCAAPGSKTIQLAMNMHNTGLVVSNDLYDFRVQLIKNNCDRYGLKNVQTICHDGVTLTELFKEESFDAILLDAPCSGLGTLKHKPEIKITTKPEDLDDIVNIQKALLETADRLVKKGGSILYSTCTLNKKENERQVANFIKQHPDYQVESEKTIFPFDFHSDGFYIAKLIKSY